MSLLGSLSYDDDDEGDYFSMLHTTAKKKKKSLQFHLCLQNKKRFIGDLETKLIQMYITSAEFPKAIWRNLVICAIRFVFRDMVEQQLRLVGDASEDNVCETACRHILSLLAEFVKI